MYDLLKSTNSENTNQYKLLELTVKDAARARLLEAFDRYQEVEPDPEPDRAIQALSLGLWALILGAPFVALYLLGLVARGF
jgi:hypothetical protein